MTPTATARTLAQLTPDARHAVLADLSSDELAALEYEWRFWARPDQLPPDPSLWPLWRCWLMLAGRGAGKTRSAAEYIRAMVEAGRHRLIGIVGPTADAIRRDMIEGSSGLLAIAPPWFRPEYEPSTRRVRWPQNGAIAYLLSSEEPDRLRGLNLDLVWADELSSWSNQQATYDMLQLALRINGPKGDPPRVVISTTPKPGPLLKEIIAAPTTVLTRARTRDNAANLSPGALKYYLDRYDGTTLGRQELDGEILDAAEGALWTRPMLDRCRVTAAPETMTRVVVGVDPSGGSGDGNAECGIIVCGKGVDGHAYVLADVSGKYSPQGWARRTLDVYAQYGAGLIVAERNFGGDMVENTIRMEGAARVKLVTASRGKMVRAEPVVTCYEQTPPRVHHVGIFPDLEDQLCEWTPDGGGPSPDRLDALVWALTELVVATPNIELWGRL
jgi:phage terminase large subunit-like protein